MPKRQGGNEFGMNFQIGKDDGGEIQNNFYVVILIEMTVNGFVFDDFSSSRDHDLPCYSRFKLRLAAAELDLRYTAIVVLVEFGNLRCVLDRQRQFCL